MGNDEAETHDNALDDGDWDATRCENPGSTLSPDKFA
jgi:hypothetical protein